MGITNTDALQAACAFDADAAAPAFFSQTGFSGFVRNGAGDYTLTLDRPYVSASRAPVILASLSGPQSLAASNKISAFFASANTIRVNTLQSNESVDPVTGALADVDFNLLVVALT